MTLYSTEAFVSQVSYQQPEDDEYKSKHVGVCKNNVRIYLTFISVCCSLRTVHLAVCYTSILLNCYLQS